VDSINATHKLSNNDDLVVDPYMPMSVKDDYACMTLPESTLHPDMFRHFLVKKIFEENQSHKYNEIKNLVVRTLNRNITESEKKLTQDFLRVQEESRSSKR